MPHETSKAEIGNLCQAIRLRERHPLPLRKTTVDLREIDSAACARGVCKRCASRVTIQSDGFTRGIAVILRRFDEESCNS
jgi:hypothetical protein